MAVTPRNLYGIGISPLSIENKTYGQPEELVANKEIGLFGILREGNGAVVSAEYLSRCKTHLSQFLDKCAAENVVGKIYKISLNDKLITVLTESKNLFDNEVEIDCQDKEPLAFKFDIDFDLFERAGMTFTSNEDIMVKVNFSLMKNEEKHSYFFEERLTELNSKTFKLNFNSFTGNVPEEEPPEEEPEEEPETPEEEEPAPEIPPTEEPEAPEENGEPGEEPPAPEEEEPETPPTQPTNNTSVADEYKFFMNTLEITMPENYNPEEQSLVIYDVLLTLV